MTGLLVFSTFILGHQVFLSYKNQKALREGGGIMSSFTQHSSMVRVTAVLLLLSISFTIWTYNAFGNVALVNIPVIGYLLIMMYNHSRKVTVAEKGLFFNGRFIEWSHISKVDIIDNSSIRLSLKGDKYKIYVIDKVDGIGQLQKAIRHQLKK